MKNVTILIIINVFYLNNLTSQNVLTDSDYYKSYNDLTIMEYANNAYDLDYKICKFLSSSESFDRKMAVVDAFNTQSESEAGNLFELYLLNKYQISSIEELTNVEDRLILSYLYFTHDINYSIEILENTKGIDENRQSMTLLRFLIYSQSIYNNKCEVWREFQKIDNTIFKISDFKSSAMELLAKSINNLKFNCSNEVLVVTETKRDYDYSANENTKRFKLNYRSGVYSINVKINSVINLDFILDSGASIVLIPEDVFLVLARAGTIERDDYLGNQTFTIADGSTIEQPVFNLKSLSIGDIEIKNVTASIGEKGSDLLLGQSFQKQFRLLKIDNESQELIVEQ